MLSISPEAGKQESQLTWQNYISPGWTFLFNDNIKDEGEVIDE